MPTTEPTYGWPIPVDTDLARDGADAIADLAAAVATTVAGVEAQPAPGGVPVGTIVMWCTPTPPAGWLLCDGSALDTVAWPALHLVLGLAGNPYNPPGGAAWTIYLPNLTGRVPRGNTPSVGGGSDTTRLTTGQLPAHNHGPVTVTGGSHTHGVRNSVGTGQSLQTMAAQETSGGYTTATDPTGGGHSHTVTPLTVGKTTPDPVPTLPAWTGVAFIIKAA